MTKEVNPYTQEVEKLSDYLLMQMTRKNTYEIRIGEVRELLEEVIEKFKRFELADTTSKEKSN